MEYERIGKPQPGALSPTKLRMKLMGAHDQKKKDAKQSNSSRTSPAKSNEDSDMFKNSLLASSDGDSNEEVDSLEPAPSSVKLRGQSVHCDPKFPMSKEHEVAAGRDNKIQQYPPPKVDSSGHSSTVHPMKYIEDENLDYDSNASSSSFEFHKAERAGRSLTRSYSRPTSSKWNDAEKWLVSKHCAQQSNHSSKGHHNVHVPQGNRNTYSNMVRVAPEVASYENWLYSRNGDTKRVDNCQNGMQMSLEKFAFAYTGPQRSFPSIGVNSLKDFYPQVKDLEEDAQDKELDDSPAGTNAAIRAVCMRDMGTEMTPVASQEPSRTGTPVGSISPLRSPTSSIPSTPRGGESTPNLNEGADYVPHNGHPTETSKHELTEEEMKLKTRREIVALGMQLGKMNIAAWASKDEQEGRKSCQTAEEIESQRIEFEKRAAAWEEAEKTKHTARYKREEIKILAWESHQKAKVDAEMRRIEAEIEEMRTLAQAKLIKKIAMTRKRSDEKRAAAEEKKKRQAERTASQVESIRQTGHIPRANYTCCGLFS